MPSLASLAAPARCQLVEGFCRVLDTHGVTHLDAESMRWLLSAATLMGAVTIADGSQTIGKIAVGPVDPQLWGSQEIESVIGPTRPTPTTVGPVGQVGLLAEKTDSKKDQPDKPAAGGETNTAVREAIGRSLDTAAANDQPPILDEAWDDLDEPAVDEPAADPPPARERKPTQRVTQRRKVRPSSVWFHGRSLTEHDAGEILEQLAGSASWACRDTFWRRLAQEKVGSGEAGYALFEYNRQGGAQKIWSPIGWFFQVIHNQRQAHERGAA